MSGNKEEQTARLAEIVKKSVTGINEPILAEVQLVRQELVKIQHDVCTLQTTLHTLMDMFKSNVAPTIKSSAAVVKSTAPVTKSSVEPEVAPVKKFKTANVFLNFALQDDEFHLRDKFPCILLAEEKFALAAKESIEKVRESKDYYKKLTTEVWKNGNIQKEIKAIHVAWTAQNAEQVFEPSLQEDE